MQFVELDLDWNEPTLRRALQNNQGSLNIDSVLHSV